MPGLRAPLDYQHAAGAAVPLAPRPAAASAGEDLMAVNPGDQLRAAEDHLLGLGPPPAPVGGTSYNQRWASDAAALAAGDRSAVQRIIDRMIEEVDSTGAAGLDWGGYAGVCIGSGIVALACAHMRGPSELLEVARRWESAVVHRLALHAVPHRGTLLVVAPGARLRAPTAWTLHLRLQAWLRSPLGWYGHVVEPPGLELVDLPPEEIRRRATMQATWLGLDRGRWWKVTGLRLLQRISPPVSMVGEGWVNLPIAGVRGFVAGLRSASPMIIRAYEDGSRASWYPELACHDAPAPAAVWHASGQRWEVAQPPGIGPAAGRELQWWPKSRFVTLEEGGQLVSRGMAAVGISQPGAIHELELWVKLPTARVRYEVVLSRGPAVVREGATPAPPPAPGPDPQPTTPADEFVLSLMAGIRATERWPTEARRRWAGEYFWMTAPPPPQATARQVEVRRAMGAAVLELI
jgi:hypothetical protein